MGSSDRVSPATARRIFRYADRSSDVVSTWRRIASEISVSFSASAMPRTPIEVRPVKTRTSVTGKRMHWPPAAVSSTSSRSVQIWTSTIASPSPSFMAMMPERRALDVAGVRDGDHHVLALDQVLVLDLAFLLDDDGFARGGEFALHRRELFLDDRLDACARAQDVEIIGDFHGELVELFGNLLAAECSQPLQAQIENRLGLLQRQPRGAVG